MRQKFDPKKTSDHPGSDLMRHEQHIPKTNNHCEKENPSFFTFLLDPAGKDYLWGGTRLKKEYGKKLPIEPLAETWECSIHPDGLSFVRNGPFQGKSLAEVLERHPDILGSRHQGKKLPILIKLIDADRDLSVQVHPDDLFAAKHEKGQLGKTEFWFVLDAKPGAALIYGLREKISKEIFLKLMAEGKLMSRLQRVSVQKGDLFMVKPGMIHALGAGVVVAEIQENSNLTYRLYDYDRKDAKGNKRPLHLERGLAVANLNVSQEPRQPMRLLHYAPGFASELLCRCAYFQVERFLIHSENGKHPIGIMVTDLSFLVLLCIEGQGTLSDGEMNFSFQKGDCIFVPAGNREVRLSGKCTLLNIRG